MGERTDAGDLDAGTNALIDDEALGDATAAGARERRTPPHGMERGAHRRARGPVNDLRRRYRARPAQAPATDRVPASWLACTSAVLMVACFLQRPGKIVADTKLVVALDPANWMAQSWHLWQPLRDLGTAQTEPVGYLFPMGLFSVVGHALGIAPWVVQRAWIGLVFVAAFWGCARLADAMDMGSRPARVLAGLSYALAPLFLARTAASSGLVLGGALLPWILLPLVRPAPGRSLRQSAALSALAIACVGGISATACAAVLVGPVLWLVTRESGRARRVLAGWWVLGTVMAVAWWLLPAIVQAGYAFNFAPYAKPASVTTSFASTVEILRGLPDWLSYKAAGVAWIPAGWSLVSNAVPILATGLIAAAGVWGLCRRDLPHRWFLVLSFAVGVAVMAAGYGGTLGDPWSSSARDALSSVVGPFRDVYKFQPLVLLPLALAGAHAMTQALRWVKSRRMVMATATSGGARRWIAVPAIALAVVVIAAGASPLWTNTFVPDQAFAAVPSWWDELANWQSSLPAASRVLVVPGANGGSYAWGRPSDEPLDVNATRPYAVRGALPSGSAEETRVLDTVEQTISRGGDPGLLPFLRRAGMSYLVARNDLDWQRSGALSPTLVRQALLASGLTPSGAFGPVLDRSDSEDADRGSGIAPAPFRQLEIYAVPQAASLVSAYKASDSVVVSGGPESLLTLERQGLATNRPVVLAGNADPAHLPPTWMITDALRRRHIDPTLTADNYSYTLAPGESPAGVPQLGAQYLGFPVANHEAVAQFQGDIDGVSASSYGSRARALPEDQPANVVDGDPSSAWVAAPSGSSRGQWVEIHFRRTVDPGNVDVQLLEDDVPGRPSVTSLRITTDKGSITDQVRPDGSVQHIPVPPGPTSSLRVTLAAVSGETPNGPGAGISEISVPGASGRSFVQVPSEFGGAWAALGNAPPTFSFTRLRANPSDVSRSDEEHSLLRLFDIPQPSAYTASATAVPIPGPTLLAFLDQTQKENAQAQALPGPGAASLEVTASSTFRQLPQFRAANVVNDDALAAWVPDPSDPKPSLSFSWSGVRDIDSIHITLAAGFAAPGEVTLVTPASAAGPGEQLVVPFPPGGTLRYLALKTDKLQIFFGNVERHLDPTDVTPTPVPLGIAKVSTAAFVGTERAPLLPQTPLHIPCANGPKLTIAGQDRHFSVDTTLAALNSLQPVALTACPDAAGQAPLPLGTSQLVSSAGNSPFSIDSVVLRPVTPAPNVASDGAARSVQIGSWGAEHRTVLVGAGAGTYLAVAENYNKGWTASLDGQRLSAVKLDGWRQGFLVPAGAPGKVVLAYSPTLRYQASLILGVLLLLGLVALAFAQSRRRSPRVNAGRPPNVLVVLVLTMAVALVIGGIAVFFAPLAVILYLLSSQKGRYSRGWPRLGLIAPWVAAAAMGLAAIAVAIQPGTLPGSHRGAFGFPAQVAATIAVLMVVAGLVRSDTEPLAPDDQAPESRSNSTS